MNKGFISLLYLAAVALSMLNASANLVAFPSGDASWIVVVEPSGGSSNAPAEQVQKAEVTQLGGVKRIVLNWSDGKTTERWTVPDLPVSFEQDPRNGFISPTQNGSLKSALSDFFLTYDSFAFTWMTPETLQEKTPITYHGKQCFHYIGSATAPYANKAYKRESWIDAKTLLPVALDNGVSLSTFVFAPHPPNGPLDLPPAFQKAVHYYKTALGYP